MFIKIKLLDMIHKKSAKSVPASSSMSQFDHKVGWNPSQMIFNVESEIQCTFPFLFLLYNFLGNILSFFPINVATVKNILIKLF